MQQYKIIKKAGYECILQVNTFDTYVHVTFLTQDIAHSDRKQEPVRQFEMFLEPQELDGLITALQKTRYDWHRHNTTHKEKLYERS